MRGDVPQKRCLVCQHVNVERLNERLALDHDTVRSLASSEGIPFAHVWYHRHCHVPLDLASAASELSAPMNRERMQYFGLRGMNLMRDISSDLDERPRTRAEAEGQARGWADTIVRYLLEETDSSPEVASVSVQVIALLRDEIDADPEGARVAPMIDRALEQVKARLGL